MIVCVPLRNFMGAPVPGAPMLPTPVRGKAPAYITIIVACHNGSVPEWLHATCWNGYREACATMVRS